MIHDSHIILISPNAHYPSHNWPNTVALMCALRQKGRNVRAIIFCPAAGAIPPDLQGSVAPVFSRLPPGWRHVAAGKWQERRFGALMNLCETLACLFKAFSKVKSGKRKAESQTNTVLHFIGGSYWVVVLAALASKRHRFIYSLYGGMLSGPATGLKALLRPYLKRLLQRAVATGRLDFICENELLREELVPLVGSHVHVIPYAVDENEKLPSQEDARRRLELPLNEKIILFFGTHRLEKDYHTALKGCLALPNPPLALFVGKVISSNDPRQVVRDCHYPKARVVDEFIPEEMVKYYFAAADAVVLPYEANFSRGSGVLIECCRYLRPVVASATPYFSAFLAQHQCGVTYVSGDSVSFADATTHVLSSVGTYSAALEQARHDHSWTAAANQYIKLYEGAA